MIYLIGSLLLLSLLFIFILLNRIKKIKNNKDETLKKYYQEEKNKIDNKIKEIEERYIQEQNKYNQYANNLKELADSQREIKFKELENFFEEKRKELELEYEDYITSIDNTIEASKEELKYINNEILDAREKQNVINNEVYRRKELLDGQNYYKVQLTKDSIEDIDILMAAKSHLHNINLLDKIIYDTFVSKSVNEMIKRVLEGREPSGIYKITRIKTGEIYIGKSTNIAERWKQHCKSVFNVGTIANSLLHIKMKEDGINNFTFELLEETDKDKLTDREKYWINYYNSKNFGLNERN